MNKEITKAIAAEDGDRRTQVLAYGVITMANLGIALWLDVYLQIAPSRVLLVVLPFTVLCTLFLPSVLTLVMRDHNWSRRVEKNIARNTTSLPNDRS